MVPLVASFQLQTPYCLPLGSFVLRLPHCHAQRLAHEHERDIAVRETLEETPAPEDWKEWHVHLTKGGKEGRPLQRSIATTDTFTRGKATEEVDRQKFVLRGKVRIRGGNIIQDKRSIVRSPYLRG